MPKKRKKKTRKIEPRLLIFCEGAKDKSESAYLKALIKSYSFPVRKITVKVVDTPVNTGKELVKIAKDMKASEKDSLWVVYDKDGYTQHAATFNQAKSNGINIIFSSISFEYWILIHFNQTSKMYAKSANIIHEINHNTPINYEKNDRNLYAKTYKNIKTAIKNAKWIQQYQKAGHPNGTPAHQFNPYTNFDVLIEAIEKFIAKYS